MDVVRSFEDAAGSSHWAAILLFTAVFSQSCWTIYKDCFYKLYSGRSREIGGSGVR